MKRLPITLTVLSLAAFALLGVVSCQKEKTDEKTVVQQDPEAQRALERISEFKNQIEYYKSHPDTRVVSYISVDDAVWDLEALFNYTYAYPELCYGHTVSIDTVLALPLSTNDSVSMSDLTSFYETMYSAVSAIYHSVTLTDKQFILLDVEDRGQHNNCVDIFLHTLQGSVATLPIGYQSPSDLGPFPTGVSWGFGNNMGNSLGQHNGELDAADTLSMVLNAELVPVAPEGYSYVYTSIETKYSEHPSQHPYFNVLFPDQGPCCEFYVENPVFPDDYYLTSDQMNFHYFGEKHLITDILPYENGGIHPGNELFFIQIDDFCKRNDIAIGHHTTAHFGFQLIYTLKDKDKEILD